MMNLIIKNLIKREHAARHGANRYPAHPWAISPSGNPLARRAESARHIPGTGLGLAIVKESVELHGGTIAFESEEGRGTKFVVIIPEILPTDAQ